VFEDLRPEGEVETYLACRVASGIWRMNRVLRIEAQLFNGSPIRTVNPDVTLGEIFKSAGQNGGNPFGKLMRHESAIDRGIQRALKELRALQAARAAQEERVADGVTRELQRRAVEEALLNRGRAVNGRAPAAGTGGDLQKEPSRPGAPPTPALPPQGGGGAQPAAGEAAPGNGGGNGGASTAPRRVRSRGNGTTSTDESRLQNEPNPPPAPAVERCYGEAGPGNGTGG